MHEGYLRLDPVHVQLIPKSRSLFYPPLSGPCLDHTTSSIILVSIAFQEFQIVFIFSLIPGMIIINLESKTWVNESVLKRKLKGRIRYPESLLLQTAAPPSPSCLVPTCPLVLKFLSLSSSPWLPLPSPLGGALFGGFGTSVIGSSSSSSHSDSPLRLETASFQNQLEQFLKCVSFRTCALLKGQMQSFCVGHSSWPTPPVGIHVIWFYLLVFPSKYLL